MNIKTVNDAGWGQENGKNYAMKITIQKESGIAILIADKIDLKNRSITRNKAYFLMHKD